MLLMHPFLRTVFDSPAGLPVRLGLTWAQARGQATLVDRWSQSLGIPPLTLDWLSEGIKPDSTLFLLGSGESVEALTATEWAEVQENFSIGINAWPLHPFVPNVLAFEPFDDASTDYLQLFENVLFESRFSSRRPKVLLFRPNKTQDGSRYLLIPESLRKNARLYGRFVPNSRNLRTVSREIAMLGELQKRGGIADALVLDSGASIIRLVSLGMRLGFTKVVLIGVDLNGGQYFWEKNPKRLAERSLSSFSPGFVRPIHETMVRDTKPFVLTEVLGILNEVMRRAGGSLFAGSRESVLSDFFPVHVWNQSANPIP
jgi:hypothetical protein